MDYLQLQKTAAEIAKLNAEVAKTQADVAKVHMEMEQLRSPWRRAGRVLQNLRNSALLLLAGFSGFSAYRVTQLETQLAEVKAADVQREVAQVERQKVDAERAKDAAVALTEKEEEKLRIAQNENARLLAERIALRAPTTPPPTSVVALDSTGDVRWNARVDRTGLDSVEPSILGSVGLSASNMACQYTLTGCSEGIGTFFRSATIQTTSRRSVTGTTLSETSVVGTTLSGTISDGAPSLYAPIKLAPTIPFGSQL